MARQIRYVFFILLFSNVINVDDLKILNLKRNNIDVDINKLRLQVNRVQLRV